MCRFLCHVHVVITLFLFTSNFFSGALRNTACIGSGGKIVSEQLGANYVEISGHDQLWNNIPARNWKNWGKPRTTSVGIAGLQAEIWIVDFPNAKQKRLIFNRSVQSLCSHTTERTFFLYGDKISHPHTAGSISSVGGNSIIFSYAKSWMVFPWICSVGYVLSSGCGQADWRQE